MKPTPTPLTAALAGAFSASVMPFLWPRVADDGLWLTLAFLLVVALPAHAFVVGFGQQASGAAAVDTALLKRVGAWLAASAAVLVAAWAVRG